MCMQECTHPLQECTHPPHTHMHTNAILPETRRGCWVPKNWRYTGDIQVWVTFHGCRELNSGSLQKQYVLLTIEPVLYPFPKPSFWGWGEEAGSSSIAQAGLGLMTIFVLSFPNAGNTGTSHHIQLQSTFLMLHSKVKIQTKCFHSIILKAAVQVSSIVVQSRN